MTPNQNAGKAEESFVGGFSSAFAKVLSRDTGSPWLIAAVPDPELTPDGSDPVRTRLELDGSLRGKLCWKSIVPQQQSWHRSSCGSQPVNSEQNKPRPCSKFLMQP